ncbi:DUF6186 family protein [Nakamurella sp.]|uniref:DUF6186 family protein n=1 Tax=Nakamurella sp. TaxID=1869182 RepID=UPI003783D2B3
MTGRTVFLAGYVVVGLALVTLVLVSSRRPSAVATPTALADAATRRRVGRVIVLLVWWWVGFHVLARSA